METTSKQFRKRNAILTCLQQTDEHPSADWIYAKLKPQIPDLSLGTVYRNLALFKEQGKIVSLGNVGGVERFDGNTEPHVHFICTTCSAVTDLHQVSVPDALRATVEQLTGGEAAECRLSFTGTCEGCCRKR